jgi:hypothetical protein
MHLAALAARATKPDLWGPVGVGLLVAFIGLSVLAGGVSRSRRTNKQSVPMTITGIALAIAGGALAYTFRK